MTRNHLRVIRGQTHLICFRISWYSGKRPVWSFEKTCLPSMLTSKRPPSEGMRTSRWILFFSSVMSFSVKLTALGS